MRLSLEPVELALPTLPLAADLLQTLLVFPQTLYERRSLLAGYREREQGREAECRDDAKRGHVAGRWRFTLAALAANPSSVPNSRNTRP